MSSDVDRPGVWVGHAGPIGVNDPDAAIAFYEALGLRLIHRGDRIAAMQLRGGTHLVLDLTGDTAPVTDAPFDLMVDDLAGYRSGLESSGLAPSPIQAVGAHHVFVVNDPSGHRVAIRDSHVVGPA